jgi:hypothetical protein
LKKDLRTTEAFSLSLDLLKEKDFYSFFVDSTQTDGHRFIIIGIRELNDSE